MAGNKSTHPPQNNKNRKRRTAPFHRGGYWRWYGDLAWRTGAWAQLEVLAKRVMVRGRLRGGRLRGAHDSSTATPAELRHCEATLSTRGASSSSCNSRHHPATERASCSSVPSNTPANLATRRIAAGSRLSRPAAEPLL